MTDFILIDSRTGSSTTLPNAIITSQPESGGLWSPEILPSISSEQIEYLADMSYQDVAKTILGTCNFGVSPDELSEIIDAAYGDQWHDSDITPVQQLGDTSLYSLHLGYGPTFAFKNVALEFLPRLLSVLAKDKTLHVLGASSGDTINAAHSGVAGTNIRSIFMLPNLGPSYVQALQAKNGISNNPNALTILADMPFDPLQDIVKKINGPEFRDFKAEHAITSFNSINIARILAQVVYYFRGYSQLLKKGKIQNGDEVIFSVPSGNFGDALAGYYARKMGLPIQKIHIATNENNMLERFIRTGIYEPPKDNSGADKVDVTNAPSMDIAKSSNFERMLYDITGGNYEQIVRWYDNLKNTGSFEVDADTLAKIQDIFSASSSTDAERLDTIRAVADTYNHGIDPHTAAGVVPFLDADTGGVPVIFLETSHVAQFAKELKNQGIVVPGMEEFDSVIQAMEENTPEEGRDYIHVSGDFDETFAAIEQAITETFPNKIA